MKKKIYLILITIITYINVSAQEVHISGQFLDDKTRQPLPEVKAQSHKQDVNLTYKDGKFFGSIPMKSILNGLITLDISTPGYLPKRVTINVSGTKNVILLSKGVDIGSIKTINLSNTNKLHDTGNRNYPVTEKKIEKPLNKKDSLAFAAQLFGEKKYEGAFAIYSNLMIDSTSEVFSYLGYYYLQGIRPVLTDTAKALEFYQVSADKLDPYSINAIGRIHELNSTRFHNDSLAKYYLNKAVDMQYGRAENYVGYLLLNGSQLYPKNPQLAYELFKKAGDHQEPYGLYNIGAMYQNSEWLHQNDLIAEEYYKQAADAGIPDAQEALGELYQQGKLGKPNKKLAFQYFSLAAKQSFTPALTNLGYIYLNGDGDKIGKDYTKAFNYFSHAAANGDPSAEYGLGIMYEYAFGRPKDMKTAVIHYQYAADGNIAEAQSIISDEYLRAEYYPYDEKISFEWCFKAANNGDPYAYTLLGNKYYYGTGVDFNDSLSLLWHRKAAKLNITESLLALAGKFITDPASDDEDFSEALYYINKAIGQGSKEAGVMYGYCFLKGIGVPLSLDSAKRIFLKYANQNVANAEYLLGYCYMFATSRIDSLQGIPWMYKAAKNNFCPAQLFMAYLCSYGGPGIKADTLVGKEWLRKSESTNAPDLLYSIALAYDGLLPISPQPTKTFRLLKRAAEWGYLDAKTNLGIFYQSGRGTKPDKKEALFWLHSAAEQNSLSAKFYLADFYLRGLLGKKDTVLAIQYLNYAADNLYAPAQCLLGELYLYGAGVPKDPQKGYELIKTAAQFGNAKEEEYFAEILLFGSEGLQNNPATAAIWFKKAAYNNNAKAQYYLASFFYNGENMKTNRDSAFWYASLSFNQGYKTSGSILGLCCEYGLGTAKNLEKAVGYFYNAMQAGNFAAKGNYGMMLFNGEGIAPDKTLGLQLMKEANQQLGGRDLFLKNFLTKIGAL